MTSPTDPHKNSFNHVRGSKDQILDRLVVSELCKGWPVYRDASEWKNYRNLFCDDAYVWTTWSRRQHIDGFIAKSKTGKANGDFIQHRECGTLVELGSSSDRAVGKMKATITQRFRIPVPLTRGDGNDDSNGHASKCCGNGTHGLNNNGDSNNHEGETTAAANGKKSTDKSNGHAGTATAQTQTESQQQKKQQFLEFDIDCDCRFHFFCLKDPQHGGEWRAKYVKLIYEKDKVVPVCVPSPLSSQHYGRVFSAEATAAYPEGYKYLGAAQALLGHQIDLELPTPRHEARWLGFYGKMEEWLRGDEDVDLISCGGGNAAATTGIDTMDLDFVAEKTDADGSDDLLDLDGAATADALDFNSAETILMSMQDAAPPPGVVVAESQTLKHTIAATGGDEKRPRLEG